MLIDNYVRDMTHTYSVMVYGWSMPFTLSDIRTAFCWYAMASLCSPVT